MRTLSDSDDGDRFETTTLQDDVGSDKLVLCVSASYPVDIDAIKKLHSDGTVIELKLGHHGPEIHWSDEKQAALANQFFETLIRYSNYKEVHIHMAAPSSMVFLFGQRYDARNLPPVSVYQYEKGSDPRYPWSISMPVSGQGAARVVWTTRQIGIPNSISA